VVDAFLAEPIVTRWLVVACAIVAAVQTILHLVSILASRRLT